MSGVFYKKKQYQDSFSLRIFLIFLIFITAYSSSFAASCTPVSARICVGSDDAANVWINGNPVNDGTDFAAVPDPDPAPCADFPAAYLTSDRNVIAVRNDNIITGYVWASWVLDIACFDGSHEYITSADGNVTYYDRPVGDPEPSDDGSVRPWYDPDYGLAGDWDVPVVVTNPDAFYLSRARHPQTSAYLAALSYSAMGGDFPGSPDNSPSGQMLYFRQEFSFLQPVAIQKTINTTMASQGDTITFCFNYSNPENTARVFQLWDTIPSVSDYIGCTGGCSVQTYGTDVVVSWTINVPAMGSGTVCVWVGANRYPYLNSGENMLAYLREKAGLLRGGSAECGCMK